MNIYHLPVLHHSQTPIAHATAAGRGEEEEEEEEEDEREEQGRRKGEGRGSRGNNDIGETFMRRLRIINSSLVRSLNNIERREGRIKSRG